jgi:WD40 repeat protein
MHELYHIFGLDTSKRGNVYHLDAGDESSLVWLGGNCLTFIDIVSLKRRYLFSIDDCGIGAFVVHPTQKFVAVGETGFNPNIYIYDYPDLQLSKTLRSGACKSFACMCFSQSGQKLATVSTSPDFMLTIWDWTNERMLLHSKVSSHRASNLSPMLLDAAGVWPGYTWCSIFSA